jgi:hypothetical protein
MQIKPGFTQRLEELIRLANQDRIVLMRQVHTLTPELLHKIDAYWRAAMENL